MAIRLSDVHEDMIDVPNLDCQTPEFLMDFWARHQHGLPRSQRELFGNVVKDGKRIARDLANYASNKATAMQCRLRGDVQTALMYEKICDRIYETLPKPVIW